MTRPQHRAHGFRIAVHTVALVFGCPVRPHRAFAKRTEKRKVKPTRFLTREGGWCIPSIEIVVIFSSIIFLVAPRPSRMVVMRMVCAWGMTGSVSAERRRVPSALIVVVGVHVGPPVARSIVHTHTADDEALKIHTHTH